MKYLRKYNESTDSSIIEDLKDIFLDVEEDGFNVYVETLTSLYNNAPVFRIGIYKSEFPVVSSPNESHRFKIKDVLETVLRSEDYMRSIGYKLNYMNSMEVGCGGNGIGYDTRTISMLSREKQLLTSTQRTDIQRMISKETFHLRIEFTLV